MSEKPEDRVFIHVSHGVQPHYTCHYNGACYGEICIDHKRCSRKWEELSVEEQTAITKFNTEVEE